MCLFPNSYNPLDYTYHRASFYVIYMVSYHIIHVIWFGFWLLEWWDISYCEIFESKSWDYVVTYLIPGNTIEISQHLLHLPSIPLHCIFFTPAQSIVWEKLLPSRTSTISTLAWSERSPQLCWYDSFWCSKPLAHLLQVKFWNHRQKPIFFLRVTTGQIRVSPISTFFCHKKYNRFHDFLKRKRYATQSVIVNGSERVAIAKKQKQYFGKTCSLEKTTAVSTYRSWVLWVVQVFCNIWPTDSPVFLSMCWFCESVGRCYLLIELGNGCPCWNRRPCTDIVKGVSAWKASYRFLISEISD